MSAQAAMVPRSVGSVVRAARAGLRAVRALECGLFFAAGVLVALGAGRLSGVQAGAWGIALLCGGLAAASWWLEHPSRLAATARTLDLALHHGGSLSLAFELEETRTADGFTAMEELVRARVLARLRLGEAVRAVFPPLSFSLATPAVAGLFLLLVLDRPGAREEPASDLGNLGAGLERALSTGLEPETADHEARDLRREARELHTLLESGVQSPPGPAGGARPTTADEARARLERLDQRVAQGLAGAPPASELRSRLEEARAWIDALRTALPAGLLASVDAGADGSGAGNLTGAAPDGTISRPMAEPTAPPALDPEATTATLGLQAGSFWPAEYDRVVERWVELSRAARAGDAR